MSLYDQAVIDAITADALPDEPLAFFRKMVRGIKKVSRKVAPVAKKLAPFAGRIVGGAIGGPTGASETLAPYAPLDVQAARLHAHLLAEGASDEVVIETFAALAVRDTRSLPIIAGIAARSLLDGRPSSRAVRRRAVKEVALAAMVLSARRGPKAVRALPKIVHSTKRTAGAKPDSARAVSMMAMKVSRSPRLTAKLGNTAP